MIGYLHQQPSNILIINKSAHSEQTEMQYELVDTSINTVSGHSLLAAQGLGLINALVDNPDIKTYLSKQQLVPVLQDYWYASAEVYIYYQQVKIQQPKVRAFIDFFLGKREQWA